MNENIAKQMLCPLCSQNENWKYPDEDIHKLRGCHFTNGKTWSPMPGHKDYEFHERIIKVLDY